MRVIGVSNHSPRSSLATPQHKNAPHPFQGATRFDFNSSIERQASRYALILCDRSYSTSVITAQPARAPAAPVGWLTRSSSPSCTIIA